MGNRGFYSSTGKFCNGRPRKPLLQKSLPKIKEELVITENLPIPKLQGYCYGFLAGNQVNLKS